MFENEDFTEDNRPMKSRNRFDLFLHAVFYSLITAAAAQFHINIFSPEFSVSLGIVFLASFSMLAQDFPVIPVSAISGIFVLLSRTFYGSFNGTSLGDAFVSSIPELFFYLFYGVLLTLYLVRMRKSSILLDTIALLFCDYAANFGELMLRLNINAFSASSQSGIIIAALFRTALILIFVTVFRRYHVVLLKKEQQDYYRHLSLLTARLQEEVIWMEKNTSLVESTMHSAYQLFERLRLDSGTKDAAKDALIIANDIHEIKKEYYLILRGLSEALLTEDGSRFLEFDELFTLLQTPVKQFAASLNKTLTFRLNGSCTFRTAHVYELLSVFRNLFMNAVEATKETEVSISVNVEETAHEIRCSIVDQGPGIAPESLPQIFDAGYSTKINYETGEISRGLGLNIVKGIVEEKLGGSIQAESCPGRTCFTIRLPKETLEGSE